MSLTELLLRLAAALCVGLCAWLPFLIVLLVSLVGRPMDRFPYGLYVAVSAFLTLPVGLVAYPMLPEGTTGVGIVFGCAVVVELVEVAILATVVNRFSDLVRGLVRIRGTRLVGRRLRKLGHPVRHDCLVGKAGGHVVRIDHALLVGGRVVVVQTGNCEGDVLAVEGASEWALFDDNGKQVKTIPSPLLASAENVRLVRDNVGFEPVGLVVMTERSTFRQAPPRGVVQVRDLPGVIGAIADRPGDGARVDWGRLMSYLDGPEAPKPEHHVAHLARARVGLDAPGERNPDLPPLKECGACKSGNVALSSGYSHYWYCFDCKTKTHIPPRPGDVKDELDFDKAFAGRGRAPVRNTSIVRGDDIPDEAYDEPEAVHATVLAPPANLPKTRWPGVRRPNSNAATH